MVFAAGYCSAPILNHLMLYDGIAFLDQNENELSMKSNDITKCFLDTLRMNTKLNKFPLNHSLLHLNMVKKGNDAIYFNPLMVLFAGHQGPERMQVLKKMFKKSF